MKFKTHKTNLNLALKVQFELGVFETEDEELIALVRSRANEHEIYEVEESPIELAQEIETTPQTEVTVAEAMLVGSALPEMRGLTAEELDKKFSAKELKSACALLGLPANGKKEILVGELIRHFEVSVSN